MTVAQPRESTVQSQRRGSLLPAIVIGLPLAAGMLALIHWGPLRHSPVYHYFVHPIETAEVVLFCGALGVLLSKLLAGVKEWRARRAEVLPAWDGRQMPPAQAATLLAGLAKVPRRLQATALVRRVGAILDFLCRRRSADDLDDHVRTLSDNDALALESSYGLVRFITWAIPILGFLGTVVGITEAISGVTPEVLEQSLSTVTDGLATAFDTTALALALTMAAMFLSNIVERQEQAVLEAVDGYVDQHLAHRFERTGTAGGEVLEVLRHGTQELLRSNEDLVRQQAELWAKTIEEMDWRRTQEEQRQQDRFVEALETALQRTLQAHEQRLANMEKQVTERSLALLQEVGGLADAVRDTGREQQAALVKVAEGVAAQAGELARLQEGEQQLLRLHDTLNRNLDSLERVETLQEAVHALAAAAHLLTARAQADVRVHRRDDRERAA